MMSLSFLKTFDLDWTLQILLGTTALISVVRSPKNDTISQRIALTSPQYCLSIILHNLLLHPLAKYPGPKLWCISRLFWCRSLIRGDLPHDVKKWHDKYGAIVRLAPDEVSFIDPEAWDSIFGNTSGQFSFNKHPFWSRKLPNGSYPISDPLQTKHAEQRKMLNHAFSPKGLREQEPILQKYSSILIDKLRVNGISDMKDWFRYITFDITVNFAPMVVLLPYCLCINAIYRYT
jgi:Cytochrome P450